MKHGFCENCGSWNGQFLPSAPVGDDALDRLTQLMLEWGRKQYWSSGAHSLQQFKDEARAALGVEVRGEPSSKETP